MKPSIYIETTIISYLTARPSKNAVRLGHQEVTRRWWRERRQRFSLFTSQFVLDEAAAGDVAAAARRLEELAAIPTLAINSKVEDLAAQLLQDGALPMGARLDALHLATAATNGVEYLMTWNCRHLANAMLRPIIERSCRAAGFEPPIICTPLELLGGAHD